MTAPPQVALSAHRGGREEAAAATVEAYQAVVHTGVDYVEFDVRRTFDGELVAFHDERVGRGGPAVSTLVYEQLCETAGYIVPKLSVVLELVAGRARGHMDLKETGYEAEVLGLATEVLGADGFMVTSLEDVSIARITTHFPHIPAALSLGRDMADQSRLAWLRVRSSELFPLRRIRTCGANWVSMHHRLASLGVLAQCARYRLNTMVWTVNDEDSINRYLRDARVNVLVTDRPQRAMALREQIR